MFYTKSVTKLGDLTVPVYHTVQKGRYVDHIGLFTVHKGTVPVPVQYRIFLTYGIGVYTAQKGGYTVQGVCAWQDQKGKIYVWS